MNTRLSFSLTRLACWTLVAAVTVTGTACGQAPPRREVGSFDPALVKEQQRRIAAFDSAVKSIDTDSAYRLWRWTLTLASPKIGQQQVECEYSRVMHRYGAAGSAALSRMEDTLWRDADPEQLRRMRTGLKGLALPVNPAVCGPYTSGRAPYWLRSWYIYALPQLPPSPTDSAPRRP